MCSNVLTVKTHLSVRNVCVSGYCENQHKQQEDVLLFLIIMNFKIFSDICSPSLLVIICSEGNLVQTSMQWFHSCCWRTSNEQRIAMQTTITSICFTKMICSLTIHYSWKIFYLSIIIITTLILIATLNWIFFLEILSLSDLTSSPSNSIFVNYIDMFNLTS